MDQEIVDILNKTPRCVTRKVIKINNSLDFFNVKHPSLGPNHTRKVDNTMLNQEQRTRDMSNVFLSDKPKDISIEEYLIGLLNEIEHYSTEFSFDEDEVKDLVQKEKWSELLDILNNNCDWEEVLEVNCNDFRSFVEAKEENKEII
tara:strand:- start:1794 stop:2231 length:438 start_codon:yes stop_codon:yes gene_type:complete